MDKDLRTKIKQYFKKEFADTMLKKLQDGHKLSSFNVNPFLITTLSKGILGEISPINMAKTLLYPRVFGTSVTTNFGDRFQKFCIQVMGAHASSTPGMDIEFIDKVEPRSLMLQIKAGPNTINSGDVDPMIEDMKSAYRLLRQNRAANLPIFAVGVVYGTHDDISGHYRKIEAESVGSQMNIPIIVGKDFWHRLTGEENFYAELIALFVEAFEQEDYSVLFAEDVKGLAKEIEEKYFTKGKLDLSKL